MLSRKDPVFCCTKDRHPTPFQPPFAHIGEALRNLVRKTPRRDAIIYRQIDQQDRQTLTYRELADLVRRTASVLSDRFGLERGQAFAFALPNQPESLVFDLAAMWTGLLAVPLDLKKDKFDRKRYKIELAECRVLFIPARRGCDDEMLYEFEQLRWDVPDLLLVSTGPNDLAAYDLYELIDAATPAPVPAEPPPLSDPCLVLYTSGTTSHPKGALLTTESLCANAYGIIEWLQFSARDRMSIVLPLHHINSTVFSLAVLLAGGSVILSSRYSASNFWPVIEQESATCSSIVPTIMVDLLARQAEFVENRYDVSSLAKIQVGSAPVPAAAAMRFVETFGVRLVQGYGMTETSLRVTGVPSNLPSDIYELVLRDNSCGAELRYCNVRIDGAKRPDQEGEVLVRGPVLARGYLKDPEATAKAFRNGWFHTGDLGYYREIEGRRFFFVKGRIKEIIIKGGVNISPVAVENAVTAAFAPLRQCYVVGVPDERMQEEIAAVCIFEPGMSRDEQERLSQLIQSRAETGRIDGLSAYESPKYILPWDPAELPLTSTGKVQRLRLKELVLNKLTKGAAKV